MKKAIIAIVVILIIALVAMNQKDAQPDNGKPVIKIGATLPLTGNMGEAGQDYKNAIDLRLSQISEDSKYQYEVFYEDNKFEIRTDILNAQKLVSVNDVDVLMSLFTGGSATIAEIARDKEVLHFDLTWSEEIARTSKYTFLNKTQPRAMVQRWLDAAAARDIKKISIIASSHKPPQVLIGLLNELLVNYPGMEIVDTQNVNFTERDFKSIVSKMARTETDVYLNLLISPSVDMWGQEMKIQKIETPTSSIATILTSKNLSLFEDAWFIDNPQGSDDYLEGFKNMTGHYPYISTSVFGYDSIDMLVNICEKYDEKPTSEQIIEELLSLGTLDATFGENRIDENGFFHSIPSVRVVKNGKTELLEE